MAKACCSLHSSGFLNFAGAFDVNRILKNLDMQRVPCRPEEGQSRRRPLILVLVACNGNFVGSSVSFS